MKEKNGFTLIELLAIIVILAIIAVITVPIILNIIENSRKGAATDSAYGYKDSVNKTYVAELQNHNKLKLDGTYTVKSDGSLEPTEDNTFGFGDSEYGDSLDVAVSGTIPAGGKLRYSNNVLNAGCVVIGDYKVTFGTDGKVDDTVKDDCSTYEFPTTSGGNESGSEQGGESPSPTNLYLTTFDESYTNSYYNDDSSFYVYTRTNGTIDEVCGVFGSGQSGTVCLSDDSHGRNSDVAGCDAMTNESYSPGSSTVGTCLIGYTKAKMDEMLAKGAECSIFEESSNSSGYFTLSCQNDNVYCIMISDGTTQCTDVNEDIGCIPNGSCG